MIANLFAGAGGWDLAALRLGLGSPVGLEIDLDACATRAAAGLLTITVDVRHGAPERFAGRLAGLIASPPCPDFSAAGLRAGLAGKTGPLVWEPLRWAEVARPEWCAWEQVEAVAPIWRVCRDRLAELGYSAWTGILCAADYGTPQVRRRAILLASRTRRVAPPEPTHSPSGQADLLGAGLPRWVSMAEALDGREVTDVEWHGPGANGRFAATDRPARTICGARIPRFLYTGSNTTLGGGLTESYVRSLDRPAPVVDTKAGREWVLRHPGRSHSTPLATRPASAPAPTIALGHNLMDWCWERPATTVAGTPRVAPPGHHDRQWRDAVRVSLEELALLQDFPPGYPFAGNKTSRSRQIGNAIPVRLAAACLGAVA